LFFDNSRLVPRYVAGTWINFCLFVFGTSPAYWKRTENEDVGNSDDGVG
jgi:hypothetical protein